ncbi:MAG: T9SS type A sorting domain-containing protein, partial [Bacteroidia bacterium]
SAAPNASLFPAANLAQTSDGANYSMFGYTGAGITVYGFTSSTLTAVYQNPENLVNYPFTYGTISSDTYSTSYTYSSIPVTSSGTVTVTGDGSGTLNTPGNSYTNVLRLKIQTTDITNFGSFGTSTTTAVGYTYLNSLSKFQLLSVNSSTSTSSTSTVVTTNKSGNINNMVLAGIKESNKSANFSVYPNPTSDKKIELYFVLANEENYNATIYNTLGQKVKMIELGSKAPGIYNEVVDLTNLEAGVYYLHLKGNKQEGIQKIVIQ